MTQLHRSARLIRAALIALSLGTSVQATHREERLANAPDTVAEQTSALDAYSYADQPVTQVEARAATLNSYLRTLGYRRLWQASSAGEVREGWYSNALNMTVVSTARVGATASLSAQAYDGQQGRTSLALGAR